MWAATGRWWIYPLLWWLPWMTEWRVINRLRSIAEHGGMERSPDRRATTHNVRQSLLARFWVVPYNTGWHLAHHVDMGVPWRNLPAFHAELERAGYVTDAITYESYRALWRALSQRRRDDRGQGGPGRLIGSAQRRAGPRSGSSEAPTLVRSHVTSGAAVLKVSTIRFLTAAVDCHGAGGHCRDATRPFMRSSSSRGCSLG